MKLTNSLIVISLTLLLFGVKKWDDTAVIDINYQSNDTCFLKAMVNGKWVEYNEGNQLDANFGPFIDNIYDGAISASKIDAEQQTSTNNISISIRQSGKIGIGSYSGVKPFEYGLKGVTISYTDDLNRAIYLTDVNNPMSFLKISEFTDTHIKGTFSGELINSISKTKISITDGEFYIKSNSH